MTTLPTDLEPFDDATQPPTYVAIDLETTGLDPMRHGICQIGAVAWQGKKVETFTRDCNAYPCEIDKQALSVNGFTIERLRRGLSLEIALTDLLEFIVKGRPNVITVYHGAKFDVAFLENAYKSMSTVAHHRLQLALPRSGIDRVQMPGSRRVLDTSSLAYALIPTLQRPPSLKQAVEALRIPYAEQWKPHDALSDAMATYYVASELFKRRAVLERVTEDVRRTIENDADDRVSLGRRYDVNCYAAGNAAYAREVRRLLEGGGVEE